MSTQEPVTKHSSHNSPIQEVKRIVEELSERLQNPKGGSCQHGARNYFLATLNELRQVCGLPTLPSFYVYQHNPHSDGEQKRKKKSQVVEVQSTPETKDMLDVLVRAGVFPSRSQARKQWKGQLALPDMSCTFDVGKTRIVWSPQGAA